MALLGAINPVLTAGLKGDDGWQLQEYVARGRYKQLRRILENNISQEEVISENHKVAPPQRENMKSNMEELIHHFKLFTEGIHVLRAKLMPLLNTRRASSVSTSSPTVPTSLTA